MGNTGGSDGCQPQNEPGFTREKMFDRLQAIQMMMFRGQLMPKEFCVMAEIWLRSIGFGRSHAYLSAQDIAEARRMGASTVRMVLQNLILKGMVIKERTRSKNKLSIDERWLEEIMALGTKHVSGSPLGTKARNTTRETPEDVEGAVHSATTRQGIAPVCQELASADANGWLPTNLNHLVEPKPDTYGARIIVPVLDKTEVKGLDWIDEPVTGGRLALTWRHAYQQSPFQIMGTLGELSPKAKGQLAGLRRDWTWELRELHFFVSWVIADFPHILSRLTWMKNPPAAPYPGWVLAMKAHLFDIWYEMARQEFIGNMTKERLQRLQMEGMVYTQVGEGMMEQHRRYRELASQAPEPLPQEQSSTNWGATPPKRPKEKPTND